MSLFERYTQLRAAVGPADLLGTKLSRAGQVLATLFDAGERQRRLQRLRDLGQLEGDPTPWQMTQAAYDMYTGFILPSNVQFYAHYEGHDLYWLQFLRVLEEPSAMLDPVGLAIDRDVLISHMLHVVHCSIGYDLALLRIFDDGFEELERQLRQLVAGTHRRQEAIGAVIERPEYHQELLDLLPRYLDDPETHWAGVTFEAPEDTRELLDHGLEHFGDPGRLLTHATSLPETPWRSLQSWLSPTEVAA